MPLICQIHSVTIICVQESVALAVHCKYNALLNSEGSSAAGSVVLRRSDTYLLLIGTY